MQKMFLFICISFTMVVHTGCGQSDHAKYSLSAEEFEAAVKSYPEGQLVDVRTAEEYKKNHLNGALNLDFNHKAFAEQTAALDKNKPVLVYCLSGGRSVKAAEYFRTAGFKEVYEMKGGMAQWMALGKPYEKIQRSAPGMALPEFNGLVDGDRLVLVDFYAKWCAPCKKMAPELKALAAQYKDDFTLLALNVEENETVVKSLKVAEIPFIALYKNGKIIWSRSGLTAKDEIEKAILKNR